MVVGGWVVGGGPGVVVVVVVVVRDRRGRRAPVARDRWSCWHRPRRRHRRPRARPPHPRPRRRPPGPRSAGPSTLSSRSREPRYARGLAGGTGRGRRNDGGRLRADVLEHADGLRGEIHRLQPQARDRAPGPRGTSPAPRLPAPARGRRRRDTRTPRPDGVPPPDRSRSSGPPRPAPAPRPRSRPRASGPGLGPMPDAGAARRRAGGCRRSIRPAVVAAARRRSIVLLALIRRLIPFSARSMTRRLGVAFTDGHPALQRLVVGVLDAHGVGPGSQRQLAAREEPE